ALWRGHRSRKLSDDAEVVAARHRLRKVSLGVREEDKLGNKTASALDYLLRYKHFSCIFEALKYLECCVRLVESGATLVIFTLIRCCNRSVLLNLSKEVSKLPKALDRIRSIYRLTARKYRMDTERTIVKHKMNASTNSGFSVQATPRKSRPPRRFAPDWVLKKDKLRDVVDPLGAIQMVADTFSIVL
ncbi:hypothetical protein NHX12_032767, partial [Muraenolepis orangiensis]